MTDKANTTVLVTGATGHVGRHSVERLLGEGYRVRAVVRDADRAAGIGPHDRLEVVTATLTSDDNWDKAMAGVEHVWHHASPFPVTQPRDEDEVVVPARDGALRVLAAARAEGVRRVVLTSSYAAVGYTRKPGARYDETDWTDPQDDLTPYIRSKVVAERAAWDDVRAHAGPELTVINPTGIFGPVVDGRVSASTGLVKAFLDGSMPVVPRMYFGVVDVRDVVDLHLRAMLSPAAAGERFLATGDRVVSFFEMGQIIARHRPELAARMPATELTDEQVRVAAETEPALREAARLGGQIPVISNEKARRVLGWRPREVATTIADTADSLL